MTHDWMRTMVLWNSRSIQKHGTGCELSYCDMRDAGCAFAWRSHVTKSCLSWDISDITSCNALTSRRVSLWRHVFTSRSPAIRHIHVKRQYVGYIGQWGSLGKSELQSVIRRDRTVLNQRMLSFEEQIFPALHQWGTWISCGVNVSELCPLFS